MGAPERSSRRRRALTPRSFSSGTTTISTRSNSAILDSFYTIYSTYILFFSRPPQPFRQLHSRAVGVIRLCSPTAL
ncbi:hypothetical protein FIBSPDRAFT_175525 [Athelia psychrophila]|uniref:Uncharacterized protein n=1 Tax=Athelia psychrophila TaxID=1759441 RepID=A0A166API0_9AGAM|nr:hypothetical protein FIBSPDRAFT_175525 [Fibularhizoctonia sp. CBS 109695]